MQAARLLEKGYCQSEVARRVGAHRHSVSKWAAELKAQGRAGLKKAGRAGRKPRLSAEDLGKIEQGLKRGPEALGYETGLWTTNRVTHLIEQECGVAYHPSRAWRMLRQLGWSYQRPTGRALERDEEKIRPWKQKRWAEARRKPALRQMGIDEIHLAKKQKFLTVVSNLETGEPLWFVPERKNRWSAPTPVISAVVTGWSNERPTKLWAARL